MQWFFHQSKALFPLVLVTFHTVDVLLFYTRCNWQLIFKNRFYFVLANSTNLGTRFYTLKLCRLKSGTFSLFSDVSTKHCFLELNDEQSNIVHETLARQMQLYIQYRQISTEEGLWINWTHKEDVQLGLAICGSRISKHKVSVPISGKPWTFMDGLSVRPPKRHW